MTASACFLNFFCNRAFWNARAPTLLCKVSLREMARKEATLIRHGAKLAGCGQAGKAAVGC
ncbi:hypothetical protein ACU4GH_14510, partial [Bradyrhizobium betae]